MKTSLWVILMTFLTPLISFGQEYENVREGYNPHSLRPIHESEIMFRKRLTFRMDLRQKQNHPFFAQNREITRLIIEAVREGIIQPYTNDSLRSRMHKETFLSRLRIEPEGFGLSDEERAAGFGTEDSFAGTPWEEKSAAAAQVTTFSPRELYIIELSEDLIFDRIRSRMLHDIQSITLKIPAALHPAGIEVALGTFSYKELVLQVFRGNPKAIWYNRHNAGRHINLEHAFDLRLFAARIIKFDNGSDETIADRHGNGRAGRIAELQYQQYLIEYENNLWEN